MSALKTKNDYTTAGYGALSKGTILQALDSTIYLRDWITSALIENKFVPWEDRNQRTLLQIAEAISSASTTGKVTGGTSPNTVGDKDQYILQVTKSEGTSTPSTIETITFEPGYYKKGFTVTAAISTSPEDKVLNFKELTFSDISGKIASTDIGKTKTLEPLKDFGVDYFSKLSLNVLGESPFTAYTNGTTLKINSSNSGYLFNGDYTLNTDNFDKITSSTTSLNPGIYVVEDAITLSAIETSSTTVTKIKYPGDYSDADSILLKCDYFNNGGTQALAENVLYNINSSTKITLPKLSLYLGVSFEKDGDNFKVILNTEGLKGWVESSIGATTTEVITNLATEVPAELSEIKLLETELITTIINKIKEI